METDSRTANRRGAHTPEHVVGVVHYGLGPIGRAVAALVAERPWLRSVAAVDMAEELRGSRLGDVIGRPSPGSPEVLQELPRADGAAVALHCTGSSLERVAPQLLELVDAGLHVVSTCEELSYPWAAHPELAESIDAAAAARGVTVLGTGVNPGFAMDYLVIALAAAAQRVDGVSVHRVQDAGTRRLPLQRKVGAGMDREAFEAEAAAGGRGHVGLTESVHALAAALGLRLTEVRETIEPILARVATPMSEGLIAPGQVAGIHQRAEGRTADAVVVELTLDMAVGIGPASDHVRLRGLPDLELDIPGGLPGDLVTVAIVVNAIPQVLAAAPGLRVMSELPPPRPAPP
jgi:2,4-diaminopentanoate dehydrogenase